MSVGTKKKLAVVTCSGNEEKWVKGWYESTKEIADFWVVNLTQFDDNTEKELKRYVPSDKLVILKNPWQKNFSIARNQAFEGVPDWIDYIYQQDMDEVLLQESLPELTSILNNDETFIVLVTIYNTLDQSGMRASLYYPRIYPHKHQGKKVPLEYMGEVHNQLIIDPTYSFQVIRPNISILHYGYSLDKDTMSKKHARSEELLRNQIKEDNDSFFAHLNLAQLLRAKADFIGTEKHAREVIRIVEGKDKDKYAHAELMALDQLATALMGQGKFNESIPHIEKALQIKPDHLDSLMNIGNVYLELKDIDKAEFWYKRYLFIRSRYDELKDNTNLILNHLNSSFVALYNLGVCQIFRNNIPKALEYFHKSYKEEPEFRDVFIKYLHSLKILNKEREFNQEVGKYIEEHPTKAYMVYDYLSDVCMEDCNVELSKFYAYQAAYLSQDDEMGMKNRLVNKFTNLKSIFGDVSNVFFDTHKAKEKLSLKS